MKFDRSVDEFQPSSSGIRELLVAVDVKSAQRITDRDVAALRTCMQDLKGRVRLGILLSPGAEVVALDRHILAVPFHTFFGVA